MLAIQVEGLTRLYRNGRGIRQVDLAAAQGSVYGFLGPNGAGKTTLIRTLLGFLKPQAGQATVLGVDAIHRSREVRQQVGYLPSDPALYDFLSGRDNLEFALRMRGTSDRTRLKALADRLDVDLGRRVKALSRGNKQKVAIIAALAHDPDLVILDEPTSGLDPLMQEAFLDLIREERERGKTIFMSSHIMSEVEAVCDRVGVIKDGQMVAQDSVMNLKKQRVKYIRAEFAGVVPDLRSLPGVTDWQAAGSQVRFTLAGSLAPMLTEMAKGQVVDLTVADPPLEEVFRQFYEGAGGGR